MRINIHAGHNPDGKIACGAVGFIKESTEARKVKDLVISQLKLLGNTVYDCTVNNGWNQSNVLTKIVSKCNANKVDLDVSIHFNALNKKDDGNGKTTGTEVLVLNSSSKALSYAKNVASEISKLGYKNRGIVYRTNLYFLKKTKSPAMLIECCFVNDKDDIAIYNAQSMANAIVKGIVGKNITVTIDKIYDNLDYSLVFDSKYYSNRYKDLGENGVKTDAQLFSHFINNGMKERRQGISTFNVIKYIDNNSDLRKAFGNNYIQYYKHYIMHGHNENRIHM